MLKSVLLENEKKKKQKDASHLKIIKNFHLRDTRETLERGENEKRKI